MTARVTSGLLLLIATRILSMGPLPTCVTAGTLVWTSGRSITRRAGRPLVGAIEDGFRIPVPVKRTRVPSGPLVTSMAVTVPTTPLSAAGWAGLAAGGCAAAFGSADTRAAWSLSAVAASGAAADIEPMDPPNSTSTVFHRLRTFGFPGFARVTRMRVSAAPSSARPGSILTLLTTPPVVPVGVSAVVVTLRRSMMTVIGSG